MEMKGDKFKAFAEKVGAPGVSVLASSSPVKTARNRHDAEIRAALLDALGATTPERMVVQEWAVDRAVVDVGVISADCIAGYEIKSTADSVTRLETQAPAYNLAFDTCTLVTADNHMRHALKTLPPWWALWAWRGSRIEIERIGGANVEHNAVRLLWSNELSKLLTEMGLRARAREEQMKIDEQWVTPPYKTHYRKTLTKHAMMAAVPMSPEVRAWVARALMARPGWRLANGRSARNYR